MLILYIPDDDEIPTNIPSGMTEFETSFIGSESESQLSEVLSFCFDI
jgi:hypothetical protein